VACFRSAIAAAALALLFPGARRLRDRRALAAGVAYSATMVLFVAANKLTTSANAIFLQDTAPLYLLLLGPLLLREPLRARDLVLAAVVALGMSLFFLGSERAVATAPDPARGNVVAAISGMAWALTIAGLRWARSSGMAPVLAGNLLACACTLPMALPAAGFGARDALVMLYLGVFQIGLAYVCLTRAIRHVPAFEASVVLLAEPALNPVWAYLVHGERPGGWALAGGALILAATLAGAGTQETKASATREAS